MNEKVWHGYYNPILERLYGSSEYLTPNGDRVIVTDVCSTRCPDDGTTLLAKDTVYVGEVTQWQRRVAGKPRVQDCDDIDALREEDVPDDCTCHNLHVDCPACKAVQLIRSSKGCQVHRGLNSRYTEPVQCKVCLAVKKRDGLFYILLLLPCNAASGSLREPKKHLKSETVPIGGLNQKFFFMGAPEVTRKMLRVQLYIVLLCGALTVMTCVMSSWYPQTRVRIAPPSENPFTFGWFSGYDWWKTSFLVFAIPPIFLGLMSLIFINVKAIKFLALLYLVLASLWWLAAIIVDIVFMGNANDPAQPDNPASSLNRCCTPQYYTVVPYCNGPALPLYCGPVPWTLADLGISGPFIYVFIWECLYLILSGVLAILILRLMQLVDQFIALGDDNFVKRTLAETGTPYYQAKPIATANNNNNGSNVPLLVPRR